MNSGVHWLFFSFFSGGGSSKSRPSMSCTKMSSGWRRSFWTPDGAMKILSWYFRLIPPPVIRVFCFVRLVKPKRQMSKISDRYQKIFAHLSILTGVNYQ